MGGVNKMNINLDYKGNKSFRLLSMYEGLNKGELLSKEELAEKFGVTQKTIQRDIDDLRAYLSENHFAETEVAIKYDKTRKGYYLVRFERAWLTNEEVMGLCKILLESRAFCKEELNSLINKLLIQVVPNDRNKIKSMIKSEQYHYVPLKHEKQLLSTIWEISQIITDSEIIKFTYIRQDGMMKEREVKPVAIMFSEYYFYLIAYMADGSKDFPTIFRIDRITDLKATSQYFNFPYKDKFNDGEFRRRVQFMYSGELRTVVFEFRGQSIEAVLDRLPTARVLHEASGIFTITVEVYGTGVDMWLRSQGENVKILG